jgi:hypothetical protein
MPGEDLHEIGRQGVRRAKKWLDATTRVTSSWTVYDKVPVSRLEFDWAHGGRQFSYDLGGLLHGSEYDNQMFLAECKKYTTKSQGPHFDKFLAQSYVALGAAPQVADHFMWITWHPFRIDSWNELGSPPAIRTAIEHADNRQRVLGPPENEDAIDEGRLEALSQRLWIIVLSDRQETLVISKDDRALVVSNRIKTEDD